MAKNSLYPLGHLVAIPKTAYVPSWATDCDSLRETFKRARRIVGKPTRVRVETLHVAEVKKVRAFNLTELVLSIGEANSQKADAAQL